MKRILVVDDEANMCRVLKMLLEEDGYSVLTASNGEQAIRLMESGEIVDLIISDLKMPDVDGSGILNYLKENAMSIPLIVITAFGTIKDAVEFMKNGAADFIAKPFDKEVIRLVVRRLFQMQDLQRENRLLKSTLFGARLVYKSQAMQDIMNTVAKVAPANTPILITGESGTGKELIAKAIHSFHSDRPFVRINCPAIPEALFESELFGYRRGAFTGASADFSGKAIVADGGTLFLDEIAELPLAIQPKLLRLLEEKEFEPLGSTSTVKINARFICATNRDLMISVEKGSFRTDLFYRINALTIHIPPLRDRRQDIVPVAEFFVKKYSTENGRRHMRLSDAAMQALESYPWPGNIRELRNIIERISVLSTSDVVGLTDIPFEIREHGQNSEIAAGDALSTNERVLLHAALAKTHWNTSAAARELGISRNTMRYRMNKHHLASG